MADILSGGPDPAPARRRWTTVAGAAVLAGIAALLAARSAPGRTGDPPQPTPPPAVRAADPTVVSVAVGNRWVYALVSACADRAVPICSYRLRRREVGAAGWTTLPLRTAPRSTVGLLPTVNASAADMVTVVQSPDNPRVYTSADGGATFTEHELVPGPPIDAVPDSGLVQGWFFPDRIDLLTVLEPETGRLRPLRVQPPLRGRPLRSFDLRGDVLWAAGTDPAATVSAASADRGRSWRPVPVPGLTIDDEAGWLMALAGPDGRGYLLAARRSRVRYEQVVSAWQAERTDAPWRRLPAGGPDTVLSAVVGDRGLLVTAQDGSLWRLGPDGRFRRLPQTGPLRPGTLVTGPSRVLASLPPNDPTQTLVLLSWDEGETWRTEKVT